MKSMSFRVLSLLVVASSPLVVPGVAAQDTAQHVWLGGVDSVNAADRQRLGASARGDDDFMDLFKPEAALAKGRRRGPDLQGLHTVPASVDRPATENRNRRPAPPSYRARLFGPDHGDHSPVRERHPGFHDEGGDPDGGGSSEAYSGKIDYLAWTNHAVERYWTVAGDPAIAPDDVVLQSWNDNPTHFLPETRLGTMTSVVVQTIGVQRKR